MTRGQKLSTLTAGVVTFCLLLLSACGGTSEATARRTLATAAEFRRAVAEANEEAMLDTVQVDLHTADSRAEFDARRAPYYRVEEAGRILEGVLRATESAMDAAGVDAFTEMAPCLVGALLGVETAIAGARDAGVEIPSDITAGPVLSLMRGYARNCPLPGGAP